MRKVNVSLVALSFLFWACDDSASTLDGNPVDIDRGIASDMAMNDARLLTDGGSEDLDRGLVSQDGGMPADCIPNSVNGCSDGTHQRVCNEAGNGFMAVSCGIDSICVNGECVSSACVPGDHICLDEMTVGTCRRDRTGYVAIRACDPASPCEDGRCESPCNPLGKVPSNIGCEYWSVDLDNYPDPGGDPSAVPHAVVISNTSPVPSLVTIEGPVGVPLADAEFTVGEADVHIFTFPRLDIDGTGIFDRAFKITSTQPVIVYQFNPLNNVGVASNDASLLLPKEGLGREYIALSYPSGAPICLNFEDPTDCLPPQSGYVTIVATSRGTTTVKFTPTVKVAAGGNLPEMEAGIEQEINLEEGEVLNLQAFEAQLGDLFRACTANSDCASGICLGVCLPGDMPSTDLTGTVITANQAIAVFGGHEEAVVGNPDDQTDSCCAEHLEQQLLPVSSWGSHYLAARSEPRGGSDEHWRIVASEDGTVVETTLTDPENTSFTLNRGEFREIVTSDSFEISANQPIMVGEYLVSQGRTGNRTGDPALIVTPPTTQLRSDYQIIIPNGYSENWLTVARSAGEEVRLDGAPINASNFRTFGTGQYEIAWIEVNEGVHFLESENPFYLTVFGFSAAVSYGYPGGLNLRSDAP